MKKITLSIVFVLFAFFANAQIKTTGLLNLSPNMTAILEFNQVTSMAKITITNPAASWFGLGFTYNALAGGMPPLVDCVVMRSATDLSDSMTRSTGTGNPNVDTAPNNWAIQSNSTNVAGTIRTIVATRTFNTGDTSDLVFDYNANTINLIYASPNSGSFSVGNHGSTPLSNRGIVVAPLTTLGVEDFSLNASSIYPNPSNGTFNVTTKTALSEINIYSQVGALVKTIKVDKTDATEVSVAGLQTGVYLIELKNDGEKSWKKVVVE